MKLVFLGSPPFAVPTLERLIDSPYRPVMVVTPPARPRGRGRGLVVSEVAALASDAGIALEQPVSVKDEAFLERLAALEPDVFVVASYGELLRQSFLDLARVAALNVHPSLLPRHRGATPVPATILAGDEVTGVTIQKMVLALDAGDIVVQSETRVRPGETTGELLGRLAVDSAELVVEALDRIANGTVEYTPQDAAAATYCKKLSKEDGAIDWSRPAVEIERQVRAMNPWPLATTTLPDGARLAVHGAEVLPLDAGATDRPTPGTLLSGAKNRMIIATGNGALELVTVQAPGKRALAAGDFLRGARLEPGIVLGATSDPEGPSA